MLLGGEGNDTLRGDPGADLINGGAGRDTASFLTNGSGATAVTVNLALGITGGGAAGDTLIGIENVIGSRSGDLLVGDAGVNRLEGDEGDDTLEGGVGADELLGGAGRDAVSYAGSAAGVTVNLLRPAANRGDAAGDVFSRIEDVIGSSFDDVIRGDAAANLLVGGGGTDRLRGEGGDDTLIGGAGADGLHGGDGADSFRFGSPSEGRDVILDFTPGQDRIEVSAATFGLPPGRLYVVAFQPSVTGSPYGDHPQFTYETDTGRLRWDADGDGPGKAVLIATLAGLPMPSYADFFVVA
ncbi:M10 family metallopeptidase C-terminal domain-containing protein [Roseomonas sp. CCTCC AB2023176]|uniref:M10 family metallopeptidase C-terminal domain-containing protein n=1 Tax=Roseomonas sp. CCTCC AB2023176 TaxID=3342640 RepID=UPI0035D97898